MMVFARLRDNPALAGQVRSIQGLIDSPAAPLGQAWSNAISFVIAP